MPRTIGPNEFFVTTGIAKGNLERGMVLKLTAGPTGTGNTYEPTTAATDHIDGIVSDQNTITVEDGTEVTVVQLGNSKALVVDSQTLNAGDRYGASTTAGKIQKLSATPGHLSAGAVLGNVSGTGQVVTVTIGLGGHYKV